MDLGGGGAYKARYGARELRVPRFRRSRIPLLAALRDTAEVLNEARLRLRGRSGSLLARLGPDRA